MFSFNLLSASYEIGMLFNCRQE